MPGPLFLPALQGSFGDWTYYSALVTLDDIVERIGYAAPLAENSSLAQQMQRRLDDGGRAEDIADYLLRNEDRFFNALVVGVLGGQPEWHPFSLSSHQPAHELGAVVERDQDLVGYLELSGDETLFALDGQHRLAGIRRALQQNPALGREKLSLIFVPHLATPAGVIRTRTLFISLNKKAVPVKRADIIILDEVDLTAIITRRLIDTDARFNRDVIDVQRFGNAIPANSPSWTTIGNFYDANNMLIRHFVEGRDEDELRDAAKIRLSEERIAFYQAGVVDFYERLARVEPLLRTVMGADAERRRAALLDARTLANPRLIARPVGLKIITAAAAELRLTSDRRHTELAINAGRAAAAVEAVRTEIEPETVAQMRDCAPAEVTAFLEEGDGAAAACEVQRCRETRQSAADDDDVFGHERDAS